MISGNSFERRVDGWNEFRYFCVHVKKKDKADKIKRYISTELCNSVQRSDQINEGLRIITRDPRA